MPQIVELPGDRTVEFPDDMSIEDMNREIESAFPDLAPKPTPLQERIGQMNKGMLMPRGTEPDAPPTPPLPNTKGALLREKQRMLESGVNADKPDLTFGEQFAGDVWRGGKNLEQVGYGLGALTAKAVGANETAKALAEGYKEVGEEASLIPGKVGSFTNIDDMASLGQYASEKFAENLAMFVPSMVTGGAGALVARKAGQKAADVLVKDLVGKGVAREVAIKTAGEALAKRTILGSAAGAFPAAAGMEAGSIYGDIYEETGKEMPGTAAGLGAVAGALDVVPTLLFLNRMVGPTTAKEIGEGLVRRVGKAAAEQVLSEGPTEGVQTAIERYGTQLADPSKRVFSQEGIEQIVDATLAGAISGAGIGAPGAVIEHHRIRRNSARAAILAKMQEQADAFSRRYKSQVVGTGIQQFQEPTDEPSPIDKLLMEEAPAEPTEPTEPAPPVDEQPAPEPPAEPTPSPAPAPEPEGTPTGETGEIPPVPPRTERTADLDEPTPPTSITNLRDILQGEGTGQEKYHQIRKLAEGLGITVKEGQEMAEAELVKMVDEIARRQDRDAREKFDAIVQLYDKQPNMSARTSTSVEQQAYSTPAPLSFGINHALGTGETTSVYEPTGGNGMLLIGADLASSHGNELNPGRAKALRNFKVGRVTENDATQFIPPGKFRQVKANPPFGTIGNINYQGYGIKKLEHLISLKALETMTDDGRAALILGAKLHEGETGHGAQWVFENYLYNNYNVVDNFEVAGDLYSKQGASFPVRVILIDGRTSKADTLKLGSRKAPPTSVDRLTTWDQLWARADLVRNAIGEHRQSVVPPGPGRLPVRPGTEGPTTEDVTRVPAPPRETGDSTSTGGDSEGTGTGDKPGEREPTGPVRKPAPGENVQGPGDSGPSGPSTTGTGDTPGRVETGSGELPERPTPDAGRGSEETGKPDDTRKLDEPPVVKPGRKAEGSELQSHYDPASKATAFGTRSPTTINEGTRKALAKLQQAVGPVDDYVANRLSMDVERLRQVLAAEQIDGVALAIYAIENGDAIIIGDETGIGKGRQGAALIRYAILNGKIPVFFTKDANLFTDMYRDLFDIETEMKPFIFGDPTKATIVDMEGAKLHRAPASIMQKREMERIQRDGWEQSGYNAIFSTYSQINKRNARQQFLERMADENDVILILDESHESAGNAETSMQAAFMTGGKLERGEGSNLTSVTVPGLLNMKGTQKGRGGVLYLSATYAKRPDNMPVYFRTALRKAAQNFNQIVEAMKKGGVALQQAVSEALAEAGQYVRRERDFSGVRFEMKRVGVERSQEIIDHVDQVTDVLSQIVQFSKKLREKLAAENKKSTAMTEDQIDVQDFAAIVHNQIGQLLLAAKADEVVKEAIEAKKRGEKPVIALTNTMETFLGKYVEEKELKAGDGIQLRWNELLKYALDRSLRTTEDTGTGDTEISTINPADYGMEDAYQAIVDAADGIESNFPVSPIDYIIQKLNKAGVKMAELTGRTSGIEFTDFEKGAGVYKRFKQANKNEVVSGFNNGKYDGMLLNASGSTGLSAHAGAKMLGKVTSDLRPRHMLIVQPAPDINVFMQTLGRIRRTGMVETGVYPGGNKYGARYTQVVLPLQAELRPAAMAARKLKSLNANTTSAAEGSVKIESEDILNKYGDEVIADYIDSNPEAGWKTGLSVAMDDDGKLEFEPDIAKKFTGRMALMTDAEQKAAYDQIIPAYKAKIEQLKTTGEYDLDIVTHEDWDGTLIENTELSVATDPSSLFTSGTRVQKWEITDNRHAPGGVEMRQEFERRSGGKQKLADDWKKFNDGFDARQDRLRTDATERLAKAEKDTDKAKAQADLDRIAEATRRWEQTRGDIVDILRDAGEIVELTNTETGDVFDAMLVDFKTPTGGRSSRSSFRFRFAVNAPGGVVHVNAAELGKKWTVSKNYKAPGDVQPIAKGTRIQRYFVIGNPIQGYENTGGLGKMVRFLSRDGHVITGLMMPQKWTVSKLAQDPRMDLISGDAVARFFHKSPRSVVEIAGLARIALNRSGDSGFELTTAGSKKHGGAIYLDDQLRAIVGDFTKTGSRFVADLARADVGRAVDRIMQITGEKFRPVGVPKVLTPMVAEANKGETAGARAPAVEQPAEPPVDEPTLPEDEPGAAGHMGPPLLPKTKAKISGPIKGLHQVAADLAKGLKVPIRFGRMGGNKYAGYFRKIANLIVTRKAVDMPTVSHEVGHKLDSVLEFSKDPVLFRELLHLGDPSLPGSMSSWTKSKSQKYRLGEGMAEFVRYWLTDPIEAEALAPGVFQAFEKAMDSNPDFGDKMRTAQDDIQTWRGADFQARLRSHISTGENPNGTPYRMRQLTRDLVDDLHIVRLFMDDIQKLAGKVDPMKNVYVLARLLRGSYGRADTFIRSGVVDFRSKAVTLGKSFEDAIKPVGGALLDFRDYIIARRAHELHSRGIETGLVNSDVANTVKKYLHNKEFNAAFKALKEWQDEVLQYAVDSGLVSEASAIRMRDLNEDYVPFHRLFEVGAGEMPSQETTGLGRGLNLGKPGSLKRQKGSVRPIVDPLETMIKNAYVLITAAEKHWIHEKLAQLASSPGAGKWIRDIATPKEQVKFELERIRKQLEDEGADLTNVPDDLLLSFWRNSARVPHGENIIKIVRGGKPHLYQLDRELFNTFQALDLEDSSKLIQMLALPANLLRSGVTLDPSFALAANPLRDAFSSAVVSKYGLLPFEATLRGVAALIGNPKIVAEWAASGGKSSVESMFFDRKKQARYLKEKIGKDLSAVDRARIIGRSPIEALGFFRELLEEATRVGEYQKAYQALRRGGLSEGDARTMAAFESRDRQDFSKGGALTKILRQVIPFWNATVQSQAKLIQSFRERPWITTAKGLAFITLAKLIEQFVNWNDDDYWDQPQWLRDNYFLIPHGKDANGRTIFWKLPTPFEPGFIFATLPGRMLQYAKQHHDADAFAGLLKAFKDSIMPSIIPNSIQAYTEVFNSGPQGWDSFRGREIVPDSLSKNPPELQFTEQTSLTARKIGEALKFSPMKIDHLLTRSAGGLGTLAIHQGFDRAISAATGEERTAKNVGVLRRFQTAPAGIQSQAVQKFYENLDRIAAETKRIELTDKGAEWADLAKEFTKAQHEMAELRKEARDAKTDVERQAYYLEMREIARAMNKAAKEDGVK